MRYSRIRHTRWHGFLLPMLFVLGSQQFVSAGPSRYALVVGVKEYPASEKLPDLSYTENDAHQISDTLKAAGYTPTLMTQKNASADGKRHLSPTATFIRKQFTALVGTPFLTKEDCVLVFLQGHGIQLPSRTNPERVTFYFCPADALIDQLKFSEDVEKTDNLIAVEELYSLLEQSSAGVKILVTDACRNDPNKPDSFRSPNSATRPAVPVPPGGIAAFFSCSKGQRAVEDADLNHGVFSHFMIEGLSGKADSNNDRQVSVLELQTYVGKRTYDYVRTKYNRTQLPDLKGDIKGFAPLVSLPKASLSPGTPNPVTPPSPKVVSGTTRFGQSKAGDLWEENGLAMKFRWCPDGAFTMGSPESEEKADGEYKGDETQVAVRITRGFWLGQFEVTQSEWEKVMGTNLLELDAKDQLTRGVGQGIAGAGPNHPVYHVSWEDAVTFCEKLTRQEQAAGRLPKDWKYTLPTEAQWEYACRAGTTTATAFGNRMYNTRANFWVPPPLNSPGSNPFAPPRGKHHQETIPVGGYKPNAWNLYDMHGNVWEWCLDSYTKKLPGGNDPFVTLPTAPKVNRGGGWADYERNCRSAKRNLGNPDFRTSSLGFRVALVQQD